MIRAFRKLVWLTLATAACTGTQLQTLGFQAEAPIDRQVQLQGHICALGPNQVVSPIKILFMMDGSGSMTRSDPDNTRGQAIVQLIESLPDDPNIFFAVMVFRGADVYYLTGVPTGTSTFSPVTTYSPTQLDGLVNQIAIYSNPASAVGGNGPNTGNTDFVKPITSAYAMIDNDIAINSVNNDGGVQVAPARYIAIFLSDGSPTLPEDPQIFQAVTEFEGLDEVAESVTFNTVHISPVPGSLCEILDGGVGPGSIECNALIFQEDAERLQEMATLGNGQFRDFENMEPVNFLSFNIGTTRRSYVIRDFYVANFSAPPNSPPDQADSDSDGLTDWLELDAGYYLKLNSGVGLDPRDPDTDHDGFSDGVEWYMMTKEGAPLNPTVFNIGCDPTLYHVDSDCDGLWDCDEQLIGGIRTQVDTDNDGAPDGLEFRMGTQLTTFDTGFDPDSDGVLNGVELKLHTNPLVPDAQTLAEYGYQYLLEADGPVDPQGIQCYNFTVQNVMLAPTLDLGEGPGYNDLYLAYSMVPEDNPSAPTIMRQLRYQGARYPQNGVKTPANGIITFQSDDFHDLCLPTDPAVWNMRP